MKVTIDDMCSGEGELAGAIIARLPLRSLGRLALASSVWAAEISKALVSPQQWERYHNILTEIKSLVPSECDSDPQLLLGLVEEADQLCGRLDVTAIDNLRAGRPFAFPNPGKRPAYTFGGRPCFRAVYARTA